MAKQKTTPETAQTAAETAAGAQTDAPEQGERGRRKTRIGVVTSDKSAKTVTVVVERRVAHPFYGKQQTRTKKFHAHDEKNEYRVGDVVRIVETRPLSRTKRWRVAELIERPE
jgi:small subunit ribosomal protein S17